MVRLFKGWQTKNGTIGWYGQLCHVDLTNAWWSYAKLWAWMSNWQYAESTYCEMEVQWPCPGNYILHRHDTECYIASIACSELTFLIRSTRHDQSGSFLRSKLPLKMIHWQNACCFQITIRWKDNVSFYEWKSWIAGPWLWCGFKRNIFIDRSPYRVIRFLSWLCQVHFCSALHRRLKDYHSICWFILIILPSNCLLTRVNCNDRHFLSHTPFSQVELISSTGVIPVQFEITIKKQHFGSEAFPSETKGGISLFLHWLTPFQVILN